ncbi:MAG: diguanylate cyclase [Gammaproteobacteria bacterium]|nr:diguanylate cyclase [Gammaproteobacteria bacterium]MBU2137468.1 diguanylate cyclase [Gammaproteobacteria bacterium]MBU2217440.1 diguanylate cyclase [Gammaproteobacteria bacterium]MBU2334289.1 diguanylate cyclase [Gammaproteobacteria bacterium]
MPETPHDSPETPPVTPHVGQSLGRRLVLTTLVFCVLFILLSATVRTFSAWNSNQEDMTNQLQLIDQVFRGTLSKAIWEMDRDALHTQLDSVSQVAIVGLVELHILKPGRAPEVFQRARPDIPTSSGKAPTLQRVLTYTPYPGGEETVGELRLVGNESLLWRQLISDVTSIVFTQVLQSLLLAGLIMWTFNRSVTVHVRHIANHLSQLSPLNLHRALQLQRSGRHQDELSLLERGVNGLQDKLSGYLERQHMAEQNLAAHRDRLAELVEERTTELRAANELLRELNRRDPLTGIANRRHFDEVKDIELRRAQRRDQPLSVLMCDVDHFKLYNDNYGHSAGDQCLQQIAQLLTQVFCRAGELVARLGGEEFAVLLPGLDAEQAQHSTQRLHRLLEQHPIAHAYSPVAPYVTLSIGVAQLGAAPDDFEALLQRADAALYRAKHQGRNRTIHT